MVTKDCTAVPVIQSQSISTKSIIENILISADNALDWLAETTEMRTKFKLTPNLRLDANGHASKEYA